MPTKMISIRLDESLLQRAKAKAQADGISFTALIAEALEKAVEPRREPQATPLPAPAVEPVPAAPERLRELDKAIRDKGVKTLAGWDPKTGKAVYR
jgi:antitoxin component of RelBE/YafQ-DinJ toxin-antitoxin module